MIAQDIQNFKSINRSIIPRLEVIPLNMKSKTFWNFSGRLGRLNGIRLIMPAIKLNKPSIITFNHL